ncbi:hypothetical protein NTGHW29_460010 [Candidatus Nitrotoga sp. HW29]|nr:hypothetical protein NTGHW29_460010 [Candidatus Nitrotoga sp. HW29]
MRLLIAGEYVHTSSYATRDVRSKDLVQNGHFFIA